jgi:hypothetical protein
VHSPIFPTIPFAPKLPPGKGVVHSPSERQTIDPKTRDALLQAIAGSRSSIDAILTGKTALPRRAYSMQVLEADRHTVQCVTLVATPCPRRP